MKRFENFLKDGSELAESNLFSIDVIYESYIKKITIENNSKNIKLYADDYFNRFNKPFSDERIVERINNNHKRLKLLVNNRLLEMTYIKDNKIFQVDVLERNDELIDKIIDDFSFRYKKKKDRYVKPNKITGKTLYKNTELQIFLTNNDIVRITYNDLHGTNELKIYINNWLYYHMDYIDDIDLAKKASGLYQNFLEEKKFKILNKTNPFK